MVNNYNEKIIKLWKANMDIQPRGSVLGIVYYISKYISKSEPAGISKSISEAIKRAQQKGGTVSHHIFAIQNAILTHRQVCACECAVRLCHLKLRDSSRKCVFVNTCHPSQRYRILRIDTDNPEPFKNIFDRYEHRPNELENLSLGEFATKYETTTRHLTPNEDDGNADAYNDEEESNSRSRYITLLDNMGKMKERSQPAILRTRYFTPASDAEGYYYSLLVTHIPFRKEGDLLQGYHNAKEAFIAKRHLLHPLSDNCVAETSARWEQEIQQGISCLVAENLADAVEATNAVQNQGGLVQDADIIVKVAAERDEVEIETVDDRMSDEDFEGL